MRALCLILASMLLALTSAPAQQSPVNHPPPQANRAPAGQASTAVPATKAVSPPSRQIQKGDDDVSWMTNKESRLAVFVLLFGAFLAAIQAFLMIKKDFRAHEIIRLSGLTFIVIATLFIITAGYGAEQIAPAMGLFGTMAGYILGRTQGGKRRDTETH
jgi:hypothetical protein